MTPTDHAAPANRESGRIRSVTGRGTARGIPELSEVVIDLEGGGEVHGRMPTPNGERVDARIVEVPFEYFEFAECPICLSPAPGSREHVPPSSMGGIVLTLTCLRCNNEFGSRFETHLQTWYEGSTGRVRLSGTTVDGRRNAGEFLLRETGSGEFLLMQNGRADPAIQELLESGAVEMHMVEPDTSAIHIGAIKSAYLAACVLMKEIPRTDRAAAIRAELLSARDSQRGTRLGLSPLFQSIRVARAAGAPQPGAVELVAMRGEAERLDFAISFSRVFAVDWPLDPIDIGRGADSLNDPS
jgi:HNH endonuclease